MATVILNADELESYYNYETIVIDSVLKRKTHGFEPLVVAEGELNDYDFKKDCEDNFGFIDLFA